MGIEEHLQGLPDGGPDHPQSSVDQATGRRLGKLQRELVAWCVALFLFGIVFSVYNDSQVTQSTDSRWTIHTILSLFAEGDVDLDEYDDLVSPDDYRIVLVDGHYYPFFPMGAPLMATPFVFVHTLLHPEVYHNIEVVHTQLEKLCASILTALAVVVVYLIARAYARTLQALLLALIFAFTTSAWSTASRALWQHGPSMLLLALALYLLVLAKERPWLAQFVALPLAMSYTVRPTNSISIIVLTGYVFFCYRNYFVRYLFWASLVAVPFLLFNLGTYGAILPPYYLASRLSIHPGFLEGLLGNLISPSRGLLLFSPVLLFILYSLWLKLRTGRLTALDGVLVSIILLHWVTISLLPRWWGGHSFGPRFFSDMLPYLSYLLVPTIIQVTRPGTSKLVRICFLLACAFGFTVHYAGATEKDTFGNWCFQPVDVEDMPSRLWDWTDPQFLRGSLLRESLIRPELEITPSMISIWYEPGEENPQTVELQITNLHHRSFHWRATLATASDEVQLSPLEGKGSKQDRLTVSISAARYSQGVHDLGDLVISARNSAVGKKTVVSVPIYLYVGQRRSVLFLPAIFRGE